MLCLRGTHPSLPLFFCCQEYKKQQGFFLKEVAISVPNRKEWVIPWAEMAIPEHGVGDSCPEVLRISSVFVGAGSDLAPIEVLSLKHISMQERHPKLLLGRCGWGEGRRSPGREQQRFRGFKTPRTQWALRGPSLK